LIPGWSRPLGALICAKAGTDNKPNNKIHDKKI
jgi:hypothetical protein